MKLIIIIILLLILLLIYYKINIENFTNEEAIQNLSSIYNSEDNMTIRNLNITTNLKTLNLTTNDISSNTLNINNNFKVDSSGNINSRDISGNSLNINNKFIIDASGRILSRISDGNLIGIRVFYMNLASKGDSVVTTIVKDEQNREYNISDWVLFLSREANDRGTHSKFWPWEVGLTVENNKWAIKTNEHTAKDGIGLRILAIPKKFIDSS